MKLLSARVENYRLHKSIVVDFKDNPTLIGGANETGKSTFIEAIHRAFFLRHNAGGAIHAGMVSTTHGGTPMVEVTFEAGGREYRLVKEFNGPRGTATLTPEDGRALSGDEAEEALAKLLSTEGAVSGGGAQNKLATQWAHLWIWQGRSGEDPAGQVRPVSGDLIQRLQESGGAVAQQSALDAEVAARVADLYSSGHTKSGSPRTGSPLDLAAKALEAAANEVETARNRVEATRADAGKVVRSREAIARHTEALAEVRQSLKDVEDRQRALEKLRTAVEAAERDLNIATEERDRRRRTEKDFKDKHAALERLRKRLEPAAAKLEQAKQALRTAQADRKEAKAALDKATGAVESARRKRDLAEAYRRQLRSREELAAREETLKAIRETRKEITSIEKQRAKLPELEARDLAELRKLEQSLAHAESTLAAIATDVERVKGTGKVTLGGEELAPGKPRQIDVPSELAVGRDIVVRISPGGGKNLEEAREALAAAQRKRQEKLEAHGLASVEAAAEALASRERLTADLKAAANRLEALAPEATAKARESLSREFDTASARVESLLQQVDDLPAPEDGTAAEDLLTACEQDLASMENELGGKRSAVAAMGDKAEKLEADLASATEAHRQITAEISHTQSGLAVLVEQYGEDRKRADDLARAEEAFKAASEKLDNLKAQRDALKPDQLEADSQRLTRSIEKTSAALQDARDELAGAEARLQSDGLEDPEELLALAEARLAAAEEAHAREARIDKATTLLHTSFKKEQQALSEQFSQPLADRINTYLQAVFGPGARAKVGLEEKQLGTIELIRDARTGAFAFDTLSGGTREQVAAAARLAIAELLAAGFDGTLPVVFDDAFTHSDPARVRELQRMLDLAVQRGLQLILLTCNPADYTTLGASVVELG
jgi:DNA repair exonuclease SbcCD ATPase subunit